MWARLLEANRARERWAGDDVDYFDRLASVPREESSAMDAYDTIERDIGRTFPRHRLFHSHNKNGQRMLRRLLHAYTELDPEVGYCQGMAFIAAAMLSYMEEEEAFWSFVSVMYSEMHYMRGLYLPGLIEVNVLMRVVERLVARHLPKLQRHFDREGLHVSMDATQWVITLFSNIFPFDLVTRVWDVFFHEGWKVFFRVSLALLKLNQRTLLSKDFEGMMDFFREFPSSVNSEEIMTLAFELPLKLSQIDRSRTLVLEEMGVDSDHHDRQRQASSSSSSS